MALSEEVVDEYKTSLADLNFNSKPLINMLTMLAEDHEQHAPEIVKVIEDHINKCKREKKLPALYLMDSIMKNLEKTSYKSLFSKNIVQTFTSVFEQVDEKTRASMFKLRQTWSTMLPNATLYRVDKKINSLLDPAWPITATEPEQTSIHVNPRFLQGKGSESEHSSPEVVEEPVEDSEDQETIMRRELIAKQQELLSLKQARLELELAEAAEKLRKKQGGKPSVASSTATPLGLPLPSLEDTLPLPEVAAKPRDPRPRPTDPRRRDPRLQNQVVSSPPSVPSTGTGPESVVASLPGQSAFQSMVPSSSQSLFPPVQPQGPYAVSQVPAAGMVPYNGLQAPGMPYQPMIGVPPNIPAHFSGEVFAQEECAKFSDDNDSDSSSISGLQGPNNTHFSKQSNVRDPRTRVEHRRTEEHRRTDSGSRVEHRNYQGRHRNSDKPVHRHTSDKPTAAVKDTHKDRDPRISSGREAHDKRKSKDREAPVPIKQSRETASRSSLKSDQQGTKHRSLSKERESKSDTKLKDSFEADRKRKEEEKKKIDVKSNRKGEERRSEKSKERTSREREKSPQKSPKQYSSKSRDIVGDKRGERKSEERKDTKTESKKSEAATNNKKGNSKSDIKKRDKNKSPDMKQSIKKSNYVESMDIDERKKPGKEAEKRCSSDGQDHERLIKKPKLEKPFTETSSALNEITSDIDNKTGDTEIMKDVDLKQEDMDVDTPEQDVPKIDDDISDLFGGEDEDYRPTVQKQQQQLPLKSPSSKGWDQFKARQPDQYAYDIALKKQREDSLVENEPVGLDEEPQDEDLRVHQPEFQRQMSAVDTMEIPEELSSNQHTKILLRAHRQLKEGLITHEQHQELLKQLGQLMQIQQLQEIQEQNRRLSGELLQPKEEVPNSDLRSIASPSRQPEQEVLARETVREVRSPDRPLDTFKIPKKSRERAEEDDRRKELSNLYPESPQEDRYRAHGPFSGRESLNRVEDQGHPPRENVGVKEPLKDEPWRGQDGRRPPRDDFVRQGPPPFRGQETQLNIEDRFDGPSEHIGPGNIEFNRRGPPDDRRGPPDDRRGLPDGTKGPPDDRREPPADRRGLPDDRRGPPDDRRGPPDERRGPPDDIRGPPDDRMGPPEDRRGPPDDRRGPPEDRRGPPDIRRGPPEDRRGPPDGRRGPLDDRRGPPDDRRVPPDDRRGPPDDRRGPPESRRGPHREDFPENRRLRPDGPLDDFDGRRQMELDLDRRGPLDRFEDAPNVREPRGPYRGNDDRRPNNWKEGQWPDRRGADGPPDQRGQRYRGPGRDFDRRGRDEKPEFFGGPPDSMGFPDEVNRSPGDPEWRDIRNPEMWRDGEIENGEFDKRGPQGRFREGRNFDRRGPNGPKDIPPEKRGHIEHPVGRGRPGLPQDRRGPREDKRGGPQGDRRHGNDEDKSIDMSPSNLKEGPQSWDDLRGDDMRGPPSHRGPPHLEGPFGRPGPPAEGSGPWFPHGRRGDSPKKEPWRGPPDKKHSNERQRPRDGPPRHGHKDDRQDEEFKPFPEQPKAKPLMSLLDPLPPRPPPGLRKTMGDPRMQGFGPRGPPRFDGPRPEGPQDMVRPGGPFQPPSDTYIDKFGDPRFRCFVDMGPIVSEEVIIGKRNFEIKLGAPPRKIPWGKDFIEVFADPSKRGIVIDNSLMYKFGERVKDVTIRGRKEKLFYHGRPLSMWIDGQHYEVRVDAPPKSMSINGKIHKIQIDGRDMMILIDKEEKGRFGGEPRFVFIDEERMEIRFDPPPRHILIDGNLCELKLNMQQPCVNIKGIYHGIRFDGPPRDVFINGKLYQIFTDHAVKLRVGNRYHYVALGGPCHEIIVDGKWFEMKFSEAPKEVNVGNQVLFVQLPGSPPEVKILPEIAQEPRPIPPGMQGPMRPGIPMPGPGPIGFAGPRGPNMVPGGPQGPGMPMPGVGPQGLPGPMQPPAGLLQQPQMNVPQSTAPAMSLPGAPVIPGIGQPVVGTQATQSSVPNVLSSLFPPVPQTSSAPAPIDINNLFAKLINTGIIKKEEEKQPEPPTQAPKPELVKPPEYILPQKKKPEEKFEDVPDMTEMDTNEMKSLPVGMIQRLYSGIQCTSCGERFMLKDGEKTEKYRQHLDWHFRQNRRGKTDMKLSSCRKWYYGIDDWIQYEEIVDSEESGKSNFFEQQQQPVDTTPTNTQNPLTLIVPEGVSAVRCPAATGNDTEDMCNICSEVFEQYWDEDLEEWHLRDAIKVNNKTYHPICYEDHTDVSEGTPSPSVLNVVEPTYMSRKSLTYDESSQDGHHASFEEERKISTICSEPMDTAVNETATPDVGVKTEPEENSVVPVTVKQEPELDNKLDIKQEPDLIKELEVKIEPGLEDMSHDQTDSGGQSDNTVPHTDIKTEPLEDHENLPDCQEDNPSVEIQSEIFDNPAKPSVEIQSESEIVDRIAEQETVTKQTEVSDKLEETAMETKDSDIPDSAEMEETETDNISDSEEPDPETQETVAETDSNTEQKEESMEADSEPEIKSDCEPKTNIEIATSGIHENTSASMSLPIEPAGCETERSPTYSKLSKIKLVIPQETQDITPEVLEIGSNASTPTQDELPSPLGEES
ncbi:uncharacterized protein LOC123558235 [Mercenaria mercenaria]|uniref:uncharacterized protein LOC123558235 n=1 Tax=Mercenaria mercenaria TaxID=6596 RepID=UPI00234F9F7F|nr:uncharacterized protein LOC123558235 [Mercenaria mercenaria]